MKPKIFIYLLIFFLILIIIVQFLIFIKYGISSYLFILSILLTLYSLLRKNSNNLIVFIKRTILVIIFLEFFLTFVPPFNFLNHYTENEYYFYRSEYKREEQCNLLKKIGKNVINYPKYGYIPFHKIDVIRDEFMYKHEYDEFGYRNNKGITNKKYDFKICILGDSFIEGVGSPSDSTIATLLQSIIGKKSKKKVLVYNAGIAGSNPIYSMNLFEKKLKNINFDLIINCIYPNDISDLYMLNHSKSIPLHEYIFATSHLARLFLINDDFMSESVKNQIYLQLSKTILRFKKQNYSKNMLNIYLPSSSEIKFKDDLISKTKKQILFDIKLDFCSILIDSTHSKSININSIYWKKDQHLKPEGNYFVANQIYNYLKNESLIIN
jgi:hypothetical protein